jgi:predicted nucleic-acid-binding protein
MRAADTNVVLRLLVQDDPAQLARARVALAGQIWICHLVLAESAWVLASAYRFDRAKIAAALTMLLSTANVVIQDREVVLAAVKTFEAESGVSFADCLILEIARKAGQLPLATFDARLGKLVGVEEL